MQSRSRPGSRGARCVGRWACGRSVAGFSAAEAGQDVVEAHTESEDGRGHEELYVVVSGSARFTLDGEEFEAPAGTLVFVSDPRVHRHGVATRARDRGPRVRRRSGVRAVRGRVDVAGARAAARDLERARSLVTEGLAEAPDNPGVWYARALVAAAEDDPDGARTWLARAIEREPALLDEALNDELLAAVAPPLC
jgi:hypothetical protein